MKDLKKMKSEFEKKCKFAEIENQMEERFGCGLWYSSVSSKRERE